MQVNDRIERLFAAHQPEIEAIVNENQCFRGHGCFMSGLKELCKASEYGNGGLLECKEANPMACPRASSYGEKYLCGCKVRKFIHAKFEL